MSVVISANVGASHKTGYVRVWVSSGEISVEFTLLPHEADDWAAYFKKLAREAKAAHRKEKKR